MQSPLDFLGGLMNHPLLQTEAENGLATNLQMSFFLPHYSLVLQIFLLYKNMLIASSLTL